jgi:hypothetical protein
MGRRRSVRRKQGGNEEREREGHRETGNSKKERRWAGRTMIVVGTIEGG